MQIQVANLDLVWMTISVEGLTKEGVPLDRVVSSNTDVSTAKGLVMEFTTAGS